MFSHSQGSSTAARYTPGHAVPADTTLDNAAWWALTGIDRHLSEGGEKARRYKPAVSPLAAVSDEHDPQTWAEMAKLAAGSPVTAVTSFIPNGWAELHALPLIQMVYAEASDGRLPSTYEFTPLVRADVPDMLALAEETKPGPFARSTIDLGGYRGRDRWRRPRRARSPRELRAWVRRAPPPHPGPG